MFGKRDTREKKKDEIAILRQKASLEIKRVTT